MTQLASYRDLVPGEGNNAFSIDRKPERENLKVTPLYEGDFSSLRVGDHVAFQDYEDDEWMQCRGLEMAVCSHEADFPVYVFDNHNHAFYGWCEGLKKGFFAKGARLVHLDAHFDDAIPPHSNVDVSNLDDVLKYTHETLQIATFIKPALKLGLFSDVINYVESEHFKSLSSLDPNHEIVLDIDLDVFCDEMSHVSWTQKVEVIKHYLPQVKMVTMATSPFFIDQKRAIDIAQRLMKEVFMD